ncbi:hypothetical protein AB0D86_46965 [Streptomyces sp. NPDC048324]|uniref:hypothetical protein n=1 Tax=Streptomyces sp. NPDC048324 TaxID=3157205 RepID=UPI0034257144
MPTDKGQDFFGVLATINAWGDRWMTDDDGIPVVMHHTPAAMTPTPRSSAPSAMNHCTSKTSRCGPGPATPHGSSTTPQSRHASPWTGTRLDEIDGGTLAAGRAAGTFGVASTAPVERAAIPGNPTIPDSVTFRPGARRRHRQCARERRDIARLSCDDRWFGGVTAGTQ